MEGPILSIRAAFEAGVNLKASNKRELCKRYRQTPSAAGQKSRDVKGTDLFFPQAGLSVKREPEPQGKILPP